MVKKQGNKTMSNPKNEKLGEDVGNVQIDLCVPCRRVGPWANVSRVAKIRLQLIRAQPHAAYA